MNFKEKWKKLEFSGKKHNTTERKLHKMMLAYKKNG